MSIATRAAFVLKTLELRGLGRKGRAELIVWEGRKRKAAECRALCVQSVKSFHSFIIKSEFGFGNHINDTRPCFPHMYKY